MDQAWGPRKSTRAQGDNAPAGSSKLVQLQRQSSAIGPILTTLNSSSSAIGGGPATPTTNGPSISGGALDFGSRGGEPGHSSAKSTGASGASGISSLGATSGTGSSTVSASTGGTGAGAGAGQTTGASTGSGVSGAFVGGAGATASALTSGSLHPLHFNWVFWFMHRAPGSKILNYESSMKKIATFGSVEDFWAVYSHLKRPHELPNVSDYHLFKQGVRPVWEDATNINGGKWIVRLKKGLASRYWENLVMAVIGDQFDVGSEICGVVLSIRGGEDILSLWNQSAHEGRINLKIRDTMKRVLNLPAETIMEYKTHNDALKDNTSFRNTDVFRINRGPTSDAIHLPTLTHTAHDNDNMLGLLPQDLGDILLRQPDNINTSHDPVKLRTLLDKINRSAWLTLGAKCHNDSYALVVAEESAKPRSASVKHSSRPGQLDTTIFFENSLPRILRTVQRYCHSDPQFIQQQPLLWQMYLLYRQHMPKADNNKRSRRRGATTSKASDPKPQSSPSTTYPWQMQFMRSGCPEITVVAFYDTFMEHGERVGYERKIPKVLVETMDYEWSSNISASRDAVQALLQVLLGCLRYRKIVGGKDKESSEGSVGLGVDSSGGPPHPEAADDEELTPKGKELTPQDNEIAKATHQMAVDLADADAALQEYLEAEAGQNFPKLLNVFSQEHDGQKSKMLVDKPIKKPGLGGSPAFVLPQDLAARRRSDVIMKEEMPDGSPALYSAGQDSLGAGSSTSGGLKRAGEGSSDSPREKRFRIGADLVKYALSGSWPDKTIAPSHHLSITAARAQSKINNPLWSPALSLNYLPQAPNKYETQLETELERWISLCGHMDGAVFADKLVSLIKDVYPSDQKFLLDQILIDYMCWDETDGREHESGESAVYRSVSSGNVCRLARPPPRVGFRSTEKLVDTVMGALVALIIKPEDSAIFTNRNSDRWSQPTELVAGEGSGNGSQEEGRGRKKKSRNVYNRRVSPFYAVLSLFHPRRATGRITGMLYLTEDEVMRKVEPMPQESVASEAPTAASTLAPAAPDLGPPSPTLSLATTSTGGGATDPTYFSPELMLHLGLEVMEGITEPSAEDRALLTKPQAKRLKRMRQKHTKMKKMAEDAGEVYVPVASGQFPGAEVFFEQLTVQLNGGDAGAAPVPDAPNPPVPEASTAPSLKQSGQGDVDMEASQQYEPSAFWSAIKDDGQEMTESAAVGGQHLELGDREEEMESMMEELSLTENLRLAKEAEAMRMECHAPFQVLIRILQYLTKANHGVALDGWISDCLADTVAPLQVLYFEWLLLELVDESPRPRQSPLKLDQEDQVRLEEEALRLIPLLMLVPTIGREPAVTAFKAVERALKGKSIPRTGADTHPDGKSFWERAKGLVDV
ncbi:Eukaryotic translation initiation factor 4E type 2 [Mortierella sp. NVP41]|nr:Eukaryotic translation initiation factor 4E type 2 [Mortierella sp. NVP41]